MHSDRILLSSAKIQMRQNILHQFKVNYSKYESTRCIGSSFIASVLMAHKVDNIQNGAK